MILSMPQIVYSRCFDNMFDVDNLFSVQQALRQCVCCDMCMMYVVFSLYLMVYHVYSF